MNYDINLHRYVVVEVKVKEFDSRDMGQLGTTFLPEEFKGSLPTIEEIESELTDKLEEE